MKKLFVVGLIVALMMVFSGVAESLETIVMYPGSYVVGKDLDAGSYLVKFDENAELEEGSKEPWADVQMFVDMDDFLRVKEDVSKFHPTKLTVKWGTTSHLSLEEGTVLNLYFYSGDSLLFFKEK